MITLLRSMSFNAKEWINIDKCKLGKIKQLLTISMLHDVLKVSRVYC